MALINWRRLGSPRTRIIGAIALPIIALIAGERAVAYAVNGNRTTSLLGRHMFAKAALIEAPRAQEPLDPARSAIEDHLEADFAPIRQVIETAPAEHTVAADGLLRDVPGRAVHARDARGHTRLPARGRAEQCACTDRVRSHCSRAGRVREADDSALRVVVEGVQAGAPGHDAGPQRVLVLSSPPSLRVASVLLA